MSLLRALLLCLACLGVVAAPAKAQDERRIVAIGDLHGDYAAYLDLVAAAGLADAKGRWTGGRSVFVQLGDVPDRGPDSLKIIRHLVALQRSAARAGGEVVVLVGNHEAMNVIGDLRYVSAGEYAAFADGGSAARRDRVYALNRAALLDFYRRSQSALSEAEVKRRWEAETPLGKVEHRIAWGPRGEVGQWVGGHPAIAKIGDTLFVHGGISVETAARPMDAVNKAVRAELAKGESQHESILTDPLGPLWYRGNVQREPEGAGAEAAAPGSDGTPPAGATRPGIGAELTQVLAAYGARRLVVAHTPHLEGVVTSEQGRLVRVDTGISSYYGGVRAYLEISKGSARAWQKGADGTWTSRTLPAPGDPAP